MFTLNARELRALDIKIVERKEIEIKPKDRPPFPRACATASYRYDLSASSLLVLARSPRRSYSKKP